jgi:hypothetical protein
MPKLSMQIKLSTVLLCLMSVSCTPYRYYVPIEALAPKKPNSKTIPFLVEDVLTHHTDLYLLPPTTPIGDTIPLRHKIRH